MGRSKGKEEGWGGVRGRSEGWGGVWRGVEE